jgi:hypothetical protein
MKDLPERDEAMEEFHDPDEGMEDFEGSVYLHGGELLSTDVRGQYRKDDGPLARYSGEMFLGVVIPCRGLDLYGGPLLLRIDGGPSIVVRVRTTRYKSKRETLIEFTGEDSPA